jgi:hypothetical protein
VPNQPPIAVTRIGCEALACTYDASGSFDPDGSSLTYRWAFGDGSVDVVASDVHAYAAPGTYSVRLDVFDDLGASGTATSSVSPVVLRATAAKVRGVSRVVLTWTGEVGAAFVVLRDGAQIATVAGLAYADELGKARSGTYRYGVCQEGLQVCSATLSVSIP